MEILIEDWKIMAADITTHSSMYIPVLVGKVKGTEITTSTVFWLDMKEKKAVTLDYIYKLGEPDKDWYKNMKRNGLDDSDLDIKMTEH